MSQWIRTRDQLPTWEDAGDWDVVDVLVLEDMWIGGMRYKGEPMQVPYNRVCEVDFSHWAKLTNKPEDES